MADKESELALSIMHVMSKRNDNASPESPLIMCMMADKHFEKIGQATVDANEDLLTRLVSDYNSVVAKSKFYPALARYREFRGFPPNPQWVRDEAWRISKTWRYVVSNAARATGSNYDSMRRLKKIIQSRQATKAVSGSGSAVCGSVLVDPYLPGELDVGSDDASDKHSESSDGIPYTQRWPASQDGPAADSMVPNAQRTPPSPDGPADDSMVPNAQRTRASSIAPAAPAASTRSLARHISTVSVASSEKDPAEDGRPTLVDLGSSPDPYAAVYDCAQHREMITGKARQRRFKLGKKKKEVKKKPASTATTPKAKTLPKLKRGAPRALAPETAGPKLRLNPDPTVSVADTPTADDTAELELQRLLKLLHEEPEGQPCDISETKRYDKMKAESLMQIRQLKTGEIVQLTSRGFHLEKFRCALAVLEKALLRGYTKPQLERMKKLILKHMRD